MGLEDAVLFLIVGTGEKGRNDHSTYLDVLSKAITKADAHNVILVYSQNNVSMGIAQKIEDIHGKDFAIEKSALPEKDMEFHADKCYTFFDGLLQKYVGKNIILDITHGTKAMSAALYAVGIHYNITDFQYVVRKKNNTGEFEDGAEFVESFDASYARWQVLFKQCRTLFSAHQYAAVKNILSGERPPKNMKTTAERCVMLSDFCEAWDRMDYKNALGNLVEFSIPELNYNYDESIHQFLEQLNKDITKSNNGVISPDSLKQNIEIAVDEVFDLYANGLRRLESAQYEDAGIRAYRMGEMLGQIHLMKAGYMSDDMPSGDKNVIRFFENKGWKPKTLFASSDVLEFLQFIGKDVPDLNKTKRERSDLRNKSILIHGYKAQVEKPEGLRNLFENLIEQTKAFISKEEFRSKKKAALFLNNNFKVENNE